MRLVLTLLVALAAVTVLPTPAKAHLCDPLDAPCVAACMAHAILGDHPCGIHQLPPPRPGVEDCPYPATGVVVTVFGTDVPACVWIA